MLFVLKFSSPRRKSLVSFERFATSSENYLVPFGQFSPFFKASSLLRNLSSLFRPMFPANSLVSFERFAPRSEFLYFFSSGLLLAFKLSSLLRNLSSFFRPVCSLRSNSLVPFERFAPCFRLLKSASKFTSLFRVVRSLF